MMPSLLDEVQLTCLKEGLANHHRFVLVAHTSPDGDAVGSTLGLADYLKGLGKQVNIVLPNAFPEFLNWIPGASDIVIFEQETERATLLIQKAEVICCLDFNDLSRVEDSMQSVINEAGAECWLFDHHLQPKDFCTLTVSFPKLSSTCEVIFRVIYELGGFPDLTYEAAQALYAGMCTDTGGFTFNSTRPEIFFIISCLLERGIDKDKIYRLIYNNNSLDRIRLQGYVLHEKLQYFDQYRSTLFTISREEQKAFNFQKGDSEGLVNIPLSIKGVRMSCQMREDEEQDRILISLRSVDDFPCNKVAEMFFNGGGHLNAAGGRLYCTLEEAVDIYHKAMAHFKPLLLGEK